MAVDIVGHINTEWSAETETKVAMLDDFCEARGYNAGTEEEPNPQTKKQFMNADIVKYIKTMAEGIRYKRAMADITVDTITIE